MHKRQQKIIKRVETMGYVSIEDLAEQLNVPPQTIRRDINTLEQQGLVTRYAWSCNG
jgi:DeoR family glycerol-3-phosphate regulon repressor